MPHVNSSGGEDLASTDEVKVYDDEGEEEKRSSENLSEDKLGLVTESEEVIWRKNSFKGMLWSATTVLDYLQPLSSSSVDECSNYSNYILDSPFQGKTSDIEARNYATGDKSGPTGPDGELKNLDYLWIISGIILNPGITWIC